MKKLIITFSIILIVATFLLLSLSNKSTTKQTAFPTPTIVLPNAQTLGRKINISGVSVNDFTKTSRPIEETTEFYVTEKSNYAIIYDSKDNSFLIGILSSPFETNRQTAEEGFLQTLGITKENACLLTVTESTPHFVNPNNAGIIYKLSFCQ